ncbi:hypothetical protein O181_001409 [Austropuccinia psidii MF-1]|uniref:Uncharacterized protein n=1 Tax=Austropuccinia psidii MF-1 TaxID=1389203 RepID=A0A9Q3GBU4_9BASI|nr:hypothetical protein [Austropuccinia psidii MF-1]
MGPLGPFFPKYSETKRGQGRIPPAPNHKWAHLSPILAPISTIPKWTKGPQDPNWPRTTSLPPSINGIPQPPDDTSSGPARLSLNAGEELSFINVPCTKASRCGAYMV